MKHTLKAIRKFLEREWFLLVTAAAIALIVLLLELI